MSTTTSRLALTQPIGSDPPSALRTSIGGNATILDNAAIYGEGTLVSRGAASASTHGTFYRTTDAGGESLAWSDGSLWLPLGLVPATTTGSQPVASGQALIVTGSAAVTVSLPSHGAGQLCAVLNRSTGGTTVSGSSIQGLGLSSASSFSLGTVGASAVLLDDGTSWNLIAGQQDTGWVALTLGTNISVSIGSTLNARLTGNVVRLASTLIASALVSGGNPIFTVPAAMKPATTQVLTPSLHVPPTTPSTVYPITINTGTGVASAQYGTSDGALTTNYLLGIDGLTYPIS